MLASVGDAKVKLIDFKTAKVLYTGSTSDGGKKCRVNSR